jgi:hypothetical protein
MNQVKAPKHLITVSKKGQLIFHANSKDDFVLWALCDYQSECGCAKFLKAWREVDPFAVKTLRENVSENNYQKMALQNAIDKAYDKNIRRIMGKRHDTPDPLDALLEDRLVACLSPIVIGAFSRARYNLVATRIHKIVSPVDKIDKTNIKVQADGDDFMSGKGNSRIPIWVSIYITPHWYSRVYKRHLEVIMGYFCLDAIDIGAGQYLVKLAVQTRPQELTATWYKYDSKENTLTEASNV